MISAILLLLLQLPTHLPVSFGPMRALDLDYSPGECVILAPAGNGRVAIGVTENGHARIHLYQFTREGDALPPAILPLDAPPDHATGADVTGDGATDLLCLYDAPPRLSVHVRSAEGFHPRSFPLETAAADVRAADINNNGRQDVALFGKTRQGVTVLYGNGRGDYTPGPTLFSERSVSDLQAGDLNGDGITDLLLLDWLANELVLHFGIGKGIFSQQSAMKLPDEPTHLAVTRLTRARTFTAVVSLPRRGELLVFEGNAAGELELRERLESGAPVLGVLTGFITPDRTPDLAFLSSSSFSVAIGATTRTFGTPVRFGAGAGCEAFAVGDLDADRLPDAALLNAGTRRLMVLGNAHGRWGSGGSLYAAGLRPAGLAIRDLNGDRLLDIAVANPGSAGVSILLNRGDRSFWGQQAVTLDDRPVYLHPAGPPTGVSRTLVTSGSANDQVTILTVGGDIAASTTATIPTGVSPFVVFAREDSSTGSFEMLVRYESPADRSLSLSLFERIRDRQFIERSLRPGLPARIAALTVAEMVSAGREDLVVVTRRTSPARLTASLGPAGERFMFDPLRELFSLPDSTAGTIGVVVAPVDADPYEDILLLLGEPRDAIAVAYGTGSGGVRERIDLIEHVRAVHDDMLLVRDVDGNGKNDVITVDLLRNAVVVIPQKPEGGFRPPSVVVHASAIGGIRIAPLFAPGSHDLVLSLSETGAVSVIPDPFVR